MKLAGSCWAVGGGMLLIGIFGCSKKEIGDLVGKGAEKVQQTASQVGERVKAPLNMAGSASLTLDQAVSLDRCYAALLPLTAGRPAVLQISSYHALNDETYPSMFFRATVSARGVGELVGQKVAGEIFVQQVKDGPVWHSPDGQPVELLIKSSDDNSITGEVAQGKVTNSDTLQSIDLRGTFIATFR